LRAPAKNEIGTELSRISDWVWLTGLYLLYCLPFVYALPFVDGIRDMGIALGIARGENFPLIGPVFASRFHLGPVWYYVQSVPLTLGMPVAYLPVFMGILAGSKYYLAFSLGKELLNRRFGLFFATTLALPGWSGIDFLNTTTPMLVPALVLLCFWSAARYRSTGHPAQLIAVAAASSLAVHAHPSSIVLIIIPLYACAANVIQYRRWRLALAAIVVGLLPLLPAVIAVHQSGWSSVLPMGSTVVVEGSGHSLAGWTDAIMGFVLGGPLTTLAVLGWELAGSWLAYGTLCLASIGIAITLVHCVAGDRRAILLVLNLVLTAALVFSARPNTPWYFMHVLTLSYCACVAYGWVVSKLNFVIIAALVGVLASTQTVGILRHLGLGEGHFPVEVLDVRNARGVRGPSLGPWLSTHDWSELSMSLCSFPGDLSLHGALATIVDDQGSLAMRWACPERRPILGGNTDVNLVGLPRSLYRQLTQRPEVVIGSLGIYRAQTVFSTTQQAVSDPRVYPIRPEPNHPATTRAWRISVQAGSVLIVSKMTPGITLIDIQASLNERRLTPIYKDVFLSAFSPPRSNDPQEIELLITTNDQNWINIVSIDSASK